GQHNQIRDRQCEVLFFSRPVSRVSHMFETHDAADALILVKWNVKHCADSVGLEIRYGKISCRRIVGRVVGGDQPGMLDRGKVSREVYTSNRLTARVLTRLQVVKIDTMDC